MGLLQKIENKEASQSKGVGVLSKALEAKKKSQHDVLKDLASRADQIPIGASWKNQYFDIFCRYFKCKEAALLLFDPKENVFLHWTSIGLDETTKRRLIVAKEEFPQKKGVFNIQRWEEFSLCFSTRTLAGFSTFASIPLSWENKCMGSIIVLDPSWTNEELNDASWKELDQIIGKKSFLSQGQLPLGEIKKINKSKLLEEISNRTPSEKLTILRIEKSTLIKDLNHDHDADLFRLEQEIFGAFKRLGGERSLVYLVDEYFVLIIPTGSSIHKQLWQIQISTIFKEIYPDSSANLAEAIQVQFIESSSKITEDKIFHD